MVVYLESPCFLLAGTRLAPLAPLMLPAALVAIPAAFQVTIMALGVSRQQAADAGWVLQPKVKPNPIITLILRCGCWQRVRV